MPFELEDGVIVVDDHLPSQIDPAIGKLSEPYFEALVASSCSASESDRACFEPSVRWVRARKCGVALRFQGGRDYVGQLRRCPGLGC